MTGDPIWMKSLLAVHVTAGFGAFLLAPIALVAAKGGKQHQRWFIATVVDVAPPVKRKL